MLAFITEDSDGIDNIIIGDNYDELVKKIEKNIKYIGFDASVINDIVKDLKENRERYIFETQYRKKCYTFNSTIYELNDGMYVC